MESSYAMTVRWFESRSPLEFEPCIAGLDRWQDHTEIFDAWERAIPGVEVEPRIYDRSRFPQGNVVADFLAAMGLDMPEVVNGEDRDANVSPLSPLSVRALARINATYQLDKEKHQKVVLLLGDIDAGEDILQTGFFDSKARIAYLKQFEASNEELSRRWFGGSNVFSIPADELARYVAQDAAMSPQAIKQAVQVRLRHVVEYLAMHRISASIPLMTARLSYVMPPWLQLDEVSSNRRSKVYRKPIDAGPRGQ